MRVEEEVVQLREENQALREALEQARDQLSQTQGRLEVALERIQELEKLKTPPPSFVKANAKKPPAEENKPRKKREAKHNHARARAMPTQIVEHRLVSCPDCHLRLGGISLARLREVIDVPPPPRIEVIHHRIYKGWCAGCQKWHEAPVDVQEDVLGQGRIGVRVASMIAYVRAVLRLPIRQIQQLLFTLHGFPVSAGEIVELLHRIKAHAQAVLQELKAQIRASPAVQADETGWREDGTNGYVWSAATPTIRYYEYHHSRSGQMVKELIGEHFQGVLGSDFYAGYNIHQGLHQRCWVHFLRDVHELKEDFPHDEELLTWAKAVKAIYEEAVAWAEHGPDPALSPRQQQQARLGHQHVFEQRLWQVCQPFAHTSAPQHTLCQRVERFLPELFVFVAVPGVPAHNDVMAYCTPSAWLGCLLKLTFILVMRVFAGRREQHDPTAISMVHGNAPSSPPLPDRLWRHSIGLSGFSGG